MKTNQSTKDWNEIYLNDYAGDAKCDVQGGEDAQ